MKVVVETPSFVIDKELGIGQDNWDFAEHLAVGQLSMEKLFRTVALEAANTTSPLVKSDNSLNIDDMIFDDPLMRRRSITGEQLLNRRIFNDGLLILHHGVVLHESYRNGMTATDRHVIHSCTKSLCSMLIAIAIDDGLIETETEIALQLPEFKSQAAWQGVTLQHVLDMQAGIEYSEDYADPNADYWSYARAAGYYPTLDGQPAIGVRAWALENLNRRQHTPGTHFVYNSCLANVLGMVLESIYRKGLADIFEELLYRRCGTESAAYFNTDPQGFPITEGQFNCRLRDFARCASLMVSEGKNLAGEQILPAGFIEHLLTPDPSAQRAYHAHSRDELFVNGQYKNQFWVLDPDRKQFSMLGIHGQFAWFDINLKLMIVGMGSFPNQDGRLLMRSLNTLWQQVATTVQDFQY